jgi:hypothetical protein
VKKLLMENYADIDFSTDSGEDSSETSSAQGDGQEAANEPTPTDQPNTQVEWLDSKRGRPVLIYDGR